ncbi:MAG TPA: hypothetical protein VGA62_11485, partial [Acidimicrobiia bacterium]
MGATGATGAGVSDYQQNGTGVGTQPTVNFTNGFGVTNAGGKIVVDGSGFVHTTGTESIAGDKTFTGTTTVNNATTTATASTISTGNGLSTGQALAVDTGSSTFSTGSGTGFFYGGAADSYKGATTISNTGIFTGTLLALTADHTTAGTVLGISAKDLTTGKAIDVQLGTLYNGTTDAQGSVGAVNVRAQNFVNNVFNVSSTGAAGATSSLVNFQSSQLAGQVLNVNATSLSTGKALAVTLGTAGTGIYVNTANLYSGNLVSLNVNGSARLTVDQGGNITGPATSTFSIDNGNASAINIGGTNATTLNLGRSGQTQALLGNATVAGTLGVTGNLSVNTNKFAVNAGTGAITGPNTGSLTIDNGNASSIDIGATTATTLNLGRSGQTQALLGNATVGGTLNGATGGAFSIDNNTAAAINIGGTTATTLNLGRSGQTQALLGNATVAGTLNVTANFSVNTNKLVINSATGAITGPTTAATAFSIDNGNASAINIGGTTATTLNLGRSGQTQALLGNVTVAGTLAVTGNTTHAGSITIGGGTPILKHISVLADGVGSDPAQPNIVSTAAQTCANTSVTLAAGTAAVGDTVIGTPNGTVLPGFNMSW